MRDSRSVALGLLFVAQAATAQFLQQGPKLVGSDAAGMALQGKSVALSADGSTAVVGGWGDDGYRGAAWVFDRSGRVWSQPGPKLIGGGAVGAAWQGCSVAVSADGNTLIIGAPYDSADAGAAWVFIRSGGVWSQQGPKLVGSGAAGGALQGTSVALSADGNTALVGGLADDALTGAAWIFTRSGGEWSQQGAKLVGAGADGPAQQGSAVAISADGGTAIIGGYGDAGGVGAVWLFTRSQGVWSQQGGKLVGAGAVGRSAQGGAVALSANGSTALVGGRGDNSGVGAAWVFTRRGGQWSQQGRKLAAPDALDPDNHVLQGSSVALAADGNTAIVGAEHDSAYVGAFWVYTRSGEVWSLQGGKLVGTGATGAAHQGSAAAISADGNTAIIGGVADNGRTGAAWVFAADRCAPPVVLVSPRGRTVAAGQAATLSVIATGTSPLSYQWFAGETGDASTPVGSDASSYSTPPLTSTAAYWVKVSNSCGDADSATAWVVIGRAPRRRLERLSAASFAGLRCP